MTLGSVKLSYSERGTSLEPPFSVSTDEADHEEYLFSSSCMSATKRNTW